MIDPIYLHPSEIDTFGRKRCSDTVPLVTSIISCHLIFTDALEVTAIIPSLSLSEHHTIISTVICNNNDTKKLHFKPFPHNDTF